MCTLLSIMAEQMDCSGVEEGQFNLNRYAQRYAGLTKVARLCFVADTMPACAGEAIRLAVVELKSGINTDAYRSVFEKYGSVISQHDIRMDIDWVIETDRKAQETMDKLQSELSAVKTAGVKDSIRMSYNDIGHFLLKRGQFSESTKAFLKAKEFCTQARHMCEQGMSCMRVSIDSGNVPGAMMHANQVEMGVEVDSVTRSMKAIVMGLTYLVDGSYALASDAFLSVEEIKEVFPLTSEDVASYGTLCAMATLGRNEVNSRVLQATKFKKYFENAQEIRQLVQSFIGNRFGECISLLQKLEQQLSVDMYLSKHVARLRDLILEKIVLNYFLPYGTVNMVSMSESLRLPLVEVERITIRLISSKALHARMDSLRKLLYKCTPNGNKTETSIKNVMAVADSHSNEMTRGILKCHLFRHGMVVKLTDQESKHMKVGAGYPSGKEQEGMGIDLGMEMEGVGMPMDEIDYYP